VVKSKKDLIYSLANTYELPIDVVERIVTYQFKVVTEIMAKGEFETIRLPYLGKFSVNKSRVKYITDLKNKK
jgi:nucleoid DNA-binding protein